MANNQNLIPGQHKLTLEEQSRAGKKSAEVRRARKSFGESFINELSEGQNQDEIVKAILKKAKQGDIQSAIFIRDTIGEKPTDKVEQSGESKLIISLEGETSQWAQ
jgi:hypothetical protein